MATTSIEEPTEDQRAAVDEAIQIYRKQVRDTPALQSLLYDIDLLPEQIVLPVNAARMIAFCEVFRLLTPEQVSSLFEPAQS